jgi:uncharacterized protein (DUF779 family)
MSISTWSTELAHRLACVEFIEPDQSVSNGNINAWLPSQIFSQQPSLWSQADVGVDVVDRLDPGRVGTLEQAAERPGEGFTIIGRVTQPRPDVSRSS